MKKTILLYSMIMVTLNIIAQQQTFDITSYTAPLGWKKEVTDNTTSYTTINTKNNTWCRINIVKSTISKGTIEKDFESEWQSMVVKNYNPTSGPTQNEVQGTNGWSIKSGGANFIFNNSEAMALLTTATGYNRCASIVATTNSQDYIKDIETLLNSVNLIKPKSTPASTQTLSSNKNSIIGTWCISASNQSDFRIKNGIMSTIFRQYTFKENSSYTCNIKTFDPVSTSIFLVRESGTYQITGSNLTINPQKSVLEEWSKKTNSDQWGKLLKTQTLKFEKVTYSFSKINIQESNEWQLILKASNQTKRDGPFNNNERNAWIYIITTPARPVIKLPGE